MALDEIRHPIVTQAQPRHEGRRTLIVAGHCADNGPGSDPSRGAPPIPSSPIEDLAPDIVRQRLLVEGFYALDVDEAAIRRYFAILTRVLQLQTYGAPTIFSPRGEGQAQNQGYDAFVPLVDSGISLYVWTGRQFLSVILFTCKTLRCHAGGRRDPRLLLDE